MKLSASYNNVEFYVKSSDLSIGRRNQVHEYPLRDKPFVEDLGKKTRKFGFDAFIVGNDYQTKRDLLITELERQGAGTLNHPDFGILSVAVIDCRISESQENGGLVKFSLQFVESGDYQFPSALTNQKQSVVNSAENVLQVSKNEFLGDVDLSNSMLSDAFENTFNQTGLSIDKVTVDAVTNALKLVNIKPGDYVNFLPKNLPASTSFLRTKINKNATALKQVVQSSAVVAEVVNVIDQSFDTVTYQQATAQRDTLAKKITQLALSSTSSDGYQAHNTLRANLVNYLGDVATKLPQRRAIKIAQAQPALVVAYNHYKDATRDAEIIATNGISNANFLSASKKIEALNA